MSGIEDIITAGVIAGIADLRSKQRDREEVCAAMRRSQPWEVGWFFATQPYEDTRAFARAIHDELTSAPWIY